MTITCHSRTCRAVIPAKLPGTKGRQRIYCNDQCKRRERAAQLRQDAKAYKTLTGLLGGQS